MVRPLGRPMARKAVTLEDLREEFLAHCEARNLSGRTVEWYGDHTRRFTDWCTSQGITAPSDLRWTDLEQFVLDRRRQDFAPNTAHGYAQVLKTLCRQSYRMGYIPEGITTRFEAASGAQDHRSDVLRRTVFVPADIRIPDPDPPPVANPLDRIPGKEG